MQVPDILQATAQQLAAQQANQQANRPATPATPAIQVPILPTTSQASQADQDGVMAVEAPMSQDEELFAQLSGELTSQPASEGSSGTGMGPPERIMKPCAHWEQFKCNYGDSCKFSHDGPGGPSPRGVYPGLVHAQKGLGFADPVAAQMNTSRRSSNDGPGGLAAGESGFDSQGTWHAGGGDIGAAQGIVLNSHMQQVLGINQGTHPRQKAVTNGGSFIAGFPSDGGGGGGGGERFKTKVCAHWQQYRCNYGDSCGFKHEGLGGCVEKAGYGPAATAAAAAAAAAAAELELAVEGELGGAEGARWSPY